MLLLPALIACKKSSDDEASSGPSGDWGDAASTTSDFDGDGFAASEDCDDFDDTVNPDATEVCGNGEDDDCQGGADCDDPDCSDDPSCAGAQTAEHCFDEDDNDGDGDVDCDDADCTYDFACITCDIQVSGTCGTSWSVFSTAPRDSLGATDCGPDGGPETIYEFLVLEDTEVGVRVDPEDQNFGLGGNDVAISVLEGSCHPDLCVDSVNQAALGGVETLMFDATGGTWYYLVVEDVGGSDPDFEIEVFCN